MPQLSKRRALKEFLIMIVTIVAIYQAFRSIAGSVERQFLLHQESIALKAGQTQAEEVNKELRDGLANYRSDKGIERLARERLNLAGPDEIVVRIGK
ncbi:MAG: septum formation initiator family protein [Candidatus Obscuribacterales bacterium]|nr:septum formation initiator family protein [Candidatus Obscuribacterales bacterium]